MWRTSLLFQAPRGTADILPDEQKYWRFFEAKAHEIAASFGYGRIDPPVFEDAGLFVRSIGEATDIVEKETYTFEDRGGDLLTLRPEGTAPVCRSYLEHGMHNLPQPVRLYYLCSFFRYERPQFGRNRQLHQFGVEVLGDADSSIDAEIIEIASRFLEAVGLKGLTLKINSIGDIHCRPEYVRTLQDYYKHHSKELCSDCRRRLVRNPLRLLDCKQLACQPFVQRAPRSVDHLCEQCCEHWGEVQSHLAELELHYQIDHRLARGLDYYTRTVFEISPPQGGSQSVIAGGGRYDGLIETLGGRPTPGIGFGMGVERVIANIKDQEIQVVERTKNVVLVTHIGDTAKSVAMKTASNLRKSGNVAVLGPAGRGLRSQLRYASSINATHAIIIGDDELQRGTFTLRNLAKGEQAEVTVEGLAQALKNP